MPKHFTVRVTLDITVDPDAYNLTYGVGTNRQEITTDLRDYVLNHMQGSAAALEGAVTNVKLLP